MNSTANPTMHHSNLLIQPNEHANLRHKCLNTLSSAWSAFQASVDDSIQQISGHKSTEGKVGQELEFGLAPAYHATFVYFITREDRYAQFAKELLWPTLSMDDWTTPKFSPDGRKVELVSAYISLVWAFYMDFCGDCINADERKQIVQVLDDRSARGLLYDHEHQKGWYNQSGPINNWVSVTNGNIGCNAIMLCNESPLWLETLHTCIFHMKRYLDWIHPDGSTDEAGGYWYYGLKNALIFLEALRVNKNNLPQSIVDTGACDWLETLPQLKNSAHFPLAGILGQTYIMAFGDTGTMPKQRFNDCFAILASRCGDSQAQSAIDPSQIDTPFGFIGYDPEAPLSKNESNSTAILQKFDLGWLAARSDQSDDKALYISVRGGSNQQTHSHFDLGNFILWYNGEALITELGKFMDYPEGYFENREHYYHANTQGHNCILVDGEGQRELDNSCEICGLKNEGNTLEFQCIISSKHNYIKKHLRKFIIDLNNDPIVYVNDDIQLEKPLPVQALFHIDKQAQYHVKSSSHHVDMPQTSMQMEFGSDDALEIEFVEHADLPYICVNSKQQQINHSIKTTISCTKRSEYT